MVLVVALIVIIAVCIVSSPFIFKLSAQYRTTDKSFKDCAALNLAEAGVERAIWELNFGNVSTWGGDDGLRIMNLSPAHMDVGNTVVHLYYPGTENPVVESTGKIPYPGTRPVERKTRVVLDLSVGSWLFDVGVFGDEFVVFHGDSVVDSYDSRLGEYDELVAGEPNVGWNGDTATNSGAAGGINVLNAGIIYGDAFSGFGSDPEQVVEVGPNASIMGEKQALSEIKELPTIVPPEGLESRGDFRLNNSETEVIHESGLYSSFVLDKNAKVIINSDITLYVTDLFQMGNDSTIEILPEANVRLYLGGTFQQKNGASLNNFTHDPTKLFLLGTDSFTELYWKNGSNFYGAIYVPKADVLIDNSAQFFGAVMGKSILVQSSGGIHYDEALKDVNVFNHSGKTSWVIKSWQRVSVD